MMDPYTDALAGGFERTADTPESPDLLPPLVHAWSDQEERLRELIRAHPVSVVCAALALGYVVARTVRGL